jgi:flagellar biosynthesis/type III secretory pathway M-ring protein FliF/YscJ
MVNGKYSITEKDGKQSLQYLPRSNEEMQKLNEIVRNAIGYDPSRNDQISVINVPFDSTDEESQLVQGTEIEWWKNPDYQKLILLLVAMALAIFIMYRLLRSKEIADKMRYAYSLGDRDQMYALDHPEPSLDEIEIIDRDYLLLPADMPGQLLLEGDRQLNMPLDEQGEDMIGAAELAERTKARLQEAPEFTENAIMKMEIKNKVQNYLNEQTDEGIRLIRMLAAQDNEDRSK